LRLIKRYITVLAILILFSVAFLSCGAVSTVSVTVSYTDRNCETVVSVDLKSYEFDITSGNVFDLIECLKNDGYITFEYRDGFPCINGMAFYESPDMKYYLGWVCEINGEECEEGFYSSVSEGDVVHIYYKTFYFD